MIVTPKCIFSRGEGASKFGQYRWALLLRHESNLSKAICELRLGCRASKFWTIWMSPALKAFDNEPTSVGAVKTSFKLSCWIVWMVYHIPKMFGNWSIICSYPLPYLGTIQYSKVAKMSSVLLQRWVQLLYFVCYWDFKLVYCTDTVQDIISVWLNLFESNSFNSKICAVCCTLCALRHNDCVWQVCLVF